MGFEVYDLTRGEFPATPDECDAWLFTGSTWSAYDPDEWIARAHEFVRALHAKRHPMIGICFGHQLIARALGGEGAAAEAGWGVGVHTAFVSEHPQWMEPHRESLPLLVSHQDQVSRPPEGATVLASHAFSPYDMMQIGEHVLTFQGHPEFEPGYIQALIERRREVIGEPTAQAGIDSLSEPTEGEVVRTWIHNFLRGAATSG
jgi:GMP synthase-like glutamine amidotransferase